MTRCVVCNLLPYGRCDYHRMLYYYIVVVQDVNNGNVFMEPYWAEDAAHAEEQCEDYHKDHLEDIGMLAVGVIPEVPPKGDKL